jgi:voltage-gated potassium channel
VVLRFRLVRSGIIRDIVLLSSIVAVSNKLRLAILVAFLGFALVLSHSLFKYGYGMIFARVGHVLGLVIVLVVVAQIATEIRQAREVTVHLVVGAACVYLALAVAWVLVYFVLESLIPGSILVPGGSFPGAEAIPVEDFELIRLLHFSFASISTLGNNVVPVTYAALQLAPIEAITGQLYLAILIARLVGLSIDSGRNSDRPRSEGNELSAEH